jgi:hypothetical protein
MKEDRFSYDSVEGLKKTTDEIVSINKSASRRREKMIIIGMKEAHEKLANKHGVSLAQIEKEIKLGQIVEKEHTSDPIEAHKIAMDHISENPDYYTKLKASGLADELEKSIADTPFGSAKKDDTMSRMKTLESMGKSMIVIHNGRIMIKSVPASTYKHPNKPGEGSKKRKNLSPEDKFEAVMGEFKRGALRSGSGEIVTDRDQALAIAYSESGLSKSIMQKAKYIRRTGAPGNYKYTYKEDTTSKQYGSLGKLFVKLAEYSETSTSKEKKKIIRNLVDAGFDREQIKEKINEVREKIESRKDRGNRDYLGQKRSFNRETFDPLAVTNRIKIKKQNIDREKEKEKSEEQKKERLEKMYTSFSEEYSPAVWNSFPSAVKEHIKEILSWGDRRSFGDAYKLADRNMLNIVAREARKRGWETDHTSKNQAGKTSSRYFIVNGDKYIRISDHELPDTEQRRHARKVYGGTKWDTEIILSDYRDKKISDILDLAENEAMQKSIDFKTRLAAMIKRKTGKGTGRVITRSELLRIANTPAEYDRSYKLQDRLKWKGLDIAIENKQGSYRSGADADGHEWKTFMKHAYGRIVGTKASDNEHVDVYVGPNLDCDIIYVVHQNDPVTGKYDEDKTMIGFNDVEEAVEAYMGQYDRPGFFGGVSEFSVAEFKNALETKQGIPLYQSPVLIKGHKLVIRRR